MDLKKNNLDFDYQSLLHDIMSNGVEKETRNGTTISVFGRQIRHNMSDGFPLLTTKKMAWKQIVIELLWFLRGDTKNYCKHFMDEYLEKNELGESYRNSLRPYPIEEFINKIKTDNEFAKKWGELGPIYGAQWRGWGRKEGTFQDPYYTYKGIDQIANLISELKTNPDSRRLMVSAWNVGELDQMVLPPCHYGFQVYTREQNGQRYLSLMWNQRSVDTFLGLPFNIASYGLLLHILAEMTNMVPDELIGNLGDVHLYKNHTLQAIEQISRKPYSLPNLRVNTGFWNPENILGNDYGSIIEGLEMNDFQIEGYQSHPTIKAPLSN